MDLREGSSSERWSPRSGIGNFRSRRVIARLVDIFRGVPCGGKSSRFRHRRTQSHRSHLLEARNHQKSFPSRGSQCNKSVNRVVCISRGVARIQSGDHRTFHKLADNYWKREIKKTFFSVFSFSLS